MIHHRVQACGAEAPDARAPIHGHLRDPVLADARGGITGLSHQPEVRTRSGLGRTSSRLRLGTPGRVPPCHVRAGRAAASQELVETRHEIAIRLGGACT